jgi:hypothetical protein
MGAVGARGRAHEQSPGVSRPANLPVRPTSPRPSPPAPLRRRGSNRDPAWPHALRLFADSMGSLWCPRGPAMRFYCPNEAASCCPGHHCRALTWAAFVPDCLCGCCPQATGCGLSPCGQCWWATWWTPRCAAAAVAALLGGVVDALQGIGRCLCPPSCTNECCASERRAVDDRLPPLPSCGATVGSSVLEFLSGDIIEEERVFKELGGCEAVGDAALLVCCTSWGPPPTVASFPHPQTISAGLGAYRMPIARLPACRGQCGGRCAQPVDEARDTLWVPQDLPRSWRRQEPRPAPKPQAPLAVRGPVPSGAGGAISPAPITPLA